MLEREPAVGLGLQHHRGPLDFHPGEHIAVAEQTRDAVVRDQPRDLDHRPSIGRLEHHIPQVRRPPQRAPDAPDFHPAVHRLGRHRERQPACHRVPGPRGEDRARGKRRQQHEPERHHEGDPRRTPHG
jgi:hypothetical protein